MNTLVLLAACSTPAASGPDAARTNDTPSVDRFVAPDVVAEGGLTDLAPEVAIADRPDAATREDVPTPVDLPTLMDAVADSAPMREDAPPPVDRPTPSDVATDTAPMLDAGGRDVPEDRVAPTCSATRFEATPARHALPGRYPARAFTGIGAVGSCAGGTGRPGYALFDMNLDRRPDLVVTQACDDSAVGTDHWNVHLNVGTFFASIPERFTLPSGYPMNAFRDSAATGSCVGSTGRPGYVLFDMNLDQRADLVVTQACDDGTVGTDHWRVHFNACM